MRALLNTMAEHIISAESVGVFATGSYAALQACSWRTSRRCSVIECTLHSGFGDFNGQ
jgi:hypothetical protein